MVSSAGHAITDHWQGVDLKDMHFKEGRSYGKMIAYGQSKSANILFAKQIAARSVTSRMTTTKCLAILIVKEYYNGEKDVCEIQYLQNKKLTILVIACASIDE